MNIIEGLRKKTNIALNDLSVENAINKLKEEFVEKCQNLAEKGYCATIFDTQCHRSYPLADKITDNFVKWLEQEGFQIEKQTLNTKGHHVIHANWE